MYQYINKIVTIIFVHNWIAILYFNFKKLPLYLESQNNQK